MVLQDLVEGRVIVFYKAFVRMEETKELLSALPGAIIEVRGVIDFLLL